MLRFTEAFDVEQVTVGLQFRVLRLESSSRMLSREQAGRVAVMKVVRNVVFWAAIAELESGVATVLVLFRRFAEVALRRSS